MKHEGYDLTANPYYNFKEYKKTDPWASNVAFAKLVFSDQKKFEKRFPTLKILENSFSEFFIFMLSGGVIAKTFTINLPKILIMEADIFNNPEGIVNRGSLPAATFAMDIQISSRV